MEEPQVWLKFDQPTDEDASHEANIFLDEDGGYFVNWSNTSVGLVSTLWFARIDDAEDFLRSEGFENFTA